MWRFLITLSLGALLLLAAGCGGARENPPAGPPAAPPPGSGPAQPPPSRGIGYVQIPFEVVPEQQAPQPAADLIARHGRTGGTGFVVVAEQTYAVMAAGEKPSGGYSIEVEAVGDAEGTVEIVYRVKSPPPDSANTAAITYPVKLIRFKNPANLPVVFRQAP